jgi:sporulation protein YlmC with PRC-barrel domain
MHLQEGEPMTAQTIPVVPKDDGASVAPGLLLHLSDMDGYLIADPYPDVRGWTVVLADGRRVGKVDDLVIDTDTLTAKYLEVKVDRDVIASDDDTWVLVPVGAAHVHSADDTVVIDRLPLPGLAGAPRQERGVPTAEQERRIRDYYEPATKVAGERGESLFDQERFWGKRGAAGGAPYLSRSSGRAAGAAPLEAVVVEAVIVDGVAVRPAAGSPAPTRGADAREDRVQM